MLNQSKQPTPLYIIHNTKQITCILFSKTDDNHLYVGTRDGEFYIYDLETRRAIFKLNLTNQSLTNIVEFSEDKLFVYSRNGSIFKLTKCGNTEWNFECVYQNENYGFCKMCVLIEKYLIFVPSDQSSKIDCIDLNKFEKVASLEPSCKTGKYGMLMSMELVAENMLLLASYENGDLALFDLNSFKELSRLTIFKGHPLLSFDYSVNLNIGVAGCSELDLQQFTIKENSLNLLNETINLKNPGLNFIKIRSSDNKIFATAGWDSRVRIYGLKKAKLLCVLDFHNQNVNTLDFSKHNILACGSNDGLISFWNLFDK